MTQITCVRCSRSAQQIKAPTLPGELGRRIFESICQDCWSQWLTQQTAIINHYGLNLLDPQAKEFLKQETERFLFSANDE